MYFMKNLKFFTSIVLISIFLISNAKSANECFEKTSRAILSLIWPWMTLFLNP